MSRGSTRAWTTASAPPDALCEFALDGLTDVSGVVGGVLLEYVLDRLALHAQVVPCGSVSSGYTAAGPVRARPTICSRHSGWPAWRASSSWIPTPFPRGAVQARRLGEHGRTALDAGHVEGLHNVSMALRRLFDGANLGKQLARVGSAGTSAG